MGSFDREPLILASSLRRRFFIPSLLIPPSKTGEKKPANAQRGNGIQNFSEISTLHLFPQLEDMADMSLNAGVKDEIKKHDRSSLKPTEVADKSSVSSHDKLLATVAQGAAKDRLKPAETTEKTWKPTAEDLAQDKTES